MNKTEYNSDTREISIRLLILNTLRKWRTLFIASIVMMLFIAGGYAAKCLRSFNAQKSSRDESQYIQQEIEQNNKAIEETNNYLENSILANIDPVSEVRTEMEVAPMLKYTGEGQDVATSQLAARYSDYIRNGIDFSSLAESLGIDKRYIQEVVSIDSDTKSNYDDYSLTVVVKGSDQNVNYKIMGEIEKNLTQAEKKFNEDGIEHSLLLGKPNSTIVMDSSMMKDPNNVQLINIAHQRAEDHLKLLNKNADKLNTELQDKGTSENHAISKRKLLIYGFAGLVIGFILAFIVIMLQIVSAGYLLSENEMTEIFHTKVFGVMPVQNSKKSRFDQHLLAKIDSAYMMSENGALKGIALSIAKTAPGKSKLVLIGFNEQDYLIANTLEKMMNDKVINYINGKSLNESELKILSEADGSVVIARRNMTKLTDIRKMMMETSNWDIPVLGSIVL